MTTLIIVLGVLLLLSTGFFIYALWSYIAAKKNQGKNTQESDTNSETDNLVIESKPAETKLQTQANVLALLEQQKVIVTELRQSLVEQDRLKVAILDCWELFLSLETQLVNKDVSVHEIDQKLEEFIPLTQESGFSEMLESLVKKIAAQRSLAQAIDKDIEHKNQLLMSKMSVNAELNEKFDRIKSELEVEPEVDLKLSEMRVELVQVYQLENTIRAKLRELKEAPDNTSEEYQLALELFLNSSELDDFIAPLQNEFGDKIEELKAVAEYQANTINELKAIVKETKEQQESSKYKIDYDIIVVKLEKSLSDKKQILSRLELKLESLQMVKAKLSQDAQKHDRLVNEKDYELQLVSQSQESEMANMQSIFSQKQISLNNMEKQLDAAPLNDESQAYANELAEKVTAFKLMMSESEMFVEMLEFELEAEQKKSAELQTRLAELSEYVMQQSQRVESIDRQDSIQLEEANTELEAEINTMRKEFERNNAGTTEAADLQKKIAEIDERVIKMKQEYAEMEDKFLSSLL
ncbi:MAG: hypothetical protein ACPGUE_03050 [Marinomonas sp.]